jgi:hypothetical protein
VNVRRSARATTDDCARTRRSRSFSVPFLFRPLQEKKSATCLSRPQHIYHFVESSDRVAPA